ncbi:LPXTG cell wall anchor domain-containing protein [Staphylococcus simulans]|uniref:LPXTG cell wall anchor domain-containing protein n=1 Tax=Staphylococcus simulans TaxID=1286 RepID=UPI002DBB883A|nr:LPXTG cell wall anchor domain-containing protein [Staphylococcus simulans]MEB6837970.1 LPXTG cell wall anchor domain-containing protein [Staphylococcus simulans]
MKTAKFLGATTLAGALLFTGVSSHDANAAEVSKQQAEDNVKNLVNNNSNYSPKSGTNFTVTTDEYADPGKPDNTYSVAFGEEPNQSPSFLYVNKDTGDVYDAKGNLVQKNSNGSDNSSNTQSHATDNNVATQNNQQQTQSQEPTQATDNIQKQPAQSEAKALPETGETENTGLVTSIGTVLLAIGLLFTFKRFSKNNK